MAAAAQPALIGLDWGTSSLRGYLLSMDGSVLAAVTRPWGIQHLPAGGFPEAFTAVTGAWRSRDPALPVVAAGMVGSRQGWREVPYVECPADAAAIAHGMVPFAAEVGLIRLVPGVIQRSPLPNVLRGEETQIMGALTGEPGLVDDSLIVLPGTHSKWVTIRSGRITSFDTYMTGELFAILRDHSLLGRPAREAADDHADAATKAAAFQRGIALALESGPAGVGSRLFTARSLYLTGELRPEVTLDYLSGLIVGEEVLGALAARRGESFPPLALIGDPGLCAKYHQALTACGVADARLLGDSAAAGIQQIALAAGLFPAGACDRPAASGGG